MFANYFSFLREILERRKPLSYVNLTINLRQSCERTFLSDSATLYAYFDSRISVQCDTQDIDTIVGFVAAAVSMSTGGCRAKRPVVVVSETVEPAVL